MRVVKSFSLDDVEDKAIIDYFNSKKNKSDYLKELIKADMQNHSNFTPDQREEIENILKNFIEDYIDNNELTLKEKNNEFDKDALDALEQFD